MTIKKISRKKSSTFLALFALIFVFAGDLPAQTKQKATAKQIEVKSDLQKITRVDEITVKELFALKPENSKPLLVNFWATWCVPCVEEFPDLVKIDEEFRGKIDFITISLDDLAEINRDVPKFLAEMNAKMPAYLLNTLKENEVIGAISPDWSGGLPFTTLYNEKREVVFIKQGKIKPELLTAKINELLNIPAQTKVSDLQINELPTVKSEIFTKEMGVADAKKDVAAGIFKVKYYGLVPMASQESTDQLKKKYGIEVIYHGCLVSSGQVEYGIGYNEISIAAIERKFGKGIF